VARDAARQPAGRGAEPAPLGGRRLRARAAPPQRAARLGRRSRGDGAPFSDAVEVREHPADAARMLALRRSLLRVHAPARAILDAGLLDGYERVVAAQARFAAGDGPGARAALDEAAAIPAEERDRVLRLGADVVPLPGPHGEFAEALAEAAAREDPADPLNFRILGKIRHLRGRHAEARDALEIALLRHEANTGVTRTSAWYRYWLARAMAAAGEPVEDVAAVLVPVLARSDLLLDTARSDATFRALRDHPPFASALEDALRAFDEPVPPPASPPR
jgi:hypothetical protein